jgi:hypothetical protein
MHKDAVLQYACYSLWRDNFYFVDRTALRFTAAGAPLAARSIQILTMNQHG